MASFTDFYRMGLFPNLGQNVYVITTSFFQPINFTNPTNSKVLTIRNVNFNPIYENVYTQSATLNGEKWTKNWVGHDFFMDGMVFELVLGEAESRRGTEENLPLSMSVRMAI
jgi:putative alpha-1,2-mannosidase